MKRKGGAGCTSVSQSVGPTGHFIRYTFAEGVHTWAQSANSLEKWRAPAGFEPATPGLEGRIWLKKSRNNTEQSGTENWSCVPCGDLRATLCARPREGTRAVMAAVDCPVTSPRTGPRSTTDSGAAAGQPAPPVALCVACWGRGGGCGRGGGIARRGPAVGLMAGGAARPETDAHRGIIGRSWPSKSPLRARYAAPPPAAVDRRPIRTDPVDPAPPVVSAARRPSTFRFPVAPHQSECGPTGRPPAATTQEGPLP